MPTKKTKKKSAAKKKTVINRPARKVAAPTGDVARLQARITELEAQLAAATKHGVNLTQTVSDAGAPDGSEAVVVPAGSDENINMRQELALERNARKNAEEALRKLGEEAKSDADFREAYKGAAMVAAELDVITEEGGSVTTPETVFMAKVLARVLTTGENVDDVRAELADPPNDDEESEDDATEGPQPDDGAPPPDDDDAPPEDDDEDFDGDDDEGGDEAAP